MSRRLRDSAERNFKKTSQLIQKGQYEEALEILQKAEEISQQLKDDDILFRSYSVKGHLKQNMGEYEEALEIYVLALKANEKILSNDPYNKFYKESFQSNLKNVGTIGNILTKMRRYPQAKKSYEFGLEIAQKALISKTEDDFCQVYSATTLNNLGNLLRDMGCIEEAKEKYERALESYEKLLEGSPKNAEYQANIGTTLCGFGTFLVYIMGQFEEAKQLYERALKIQERLLETNPKNVKYQVDLGDTLHNFGVLLAYTGLTEEAREKSEKALEIRKILLENDPKNAEYISSLGMTLTNLGNLFFVSELIEESQKMYERALEIKEKIIENDPKGIEDQADVGTILNNIGNLLKYKGFFEEAKQKYERALEIDEKILEKNPKNIENQANVGMVLVNLGDLLKIMGHVEEAKERYEKALGIYTEPMQYLTVGRKSGTIIKLIQLNSEQAEKETSPFNQMKYLRDAYQICKKNQDFFVSYKLRHERKLVTEAGLSAYIDFLMKNVGLEGNSEKRAKEYEKALQAVEKLKEMEQDETVSKLCSSAVCYLRGRKLVNEALASRKPELELLRQAVEQFRNARETYDKANLCFCVYIGLLKILEGVEKFEEVDVPKLKELIRKVVETLPEDVNPSIRVSFENIPHIFEEKNKMTRKELLKELDDRVSAIEYKALENLFGHVHEKIKDYFEEPFSPNVFYENWKLKVIFDDPEKVKGKLIIKAGNKTLLNRTLTPEEVKNNLLEIDYLKIGYFPQGEDEISFTTPGQKKPVIRPIDYFESVGRDNKTRIFQCDCCNGVCVDRDLRIAAVQLKYHAYGENSVVKLTVDDAYHRKVMAVLDAVKGEADIVVFPEFSIPFDYLEKIKEYADENGIMVVAGSHYVTERKLPEYGKLFCREFEDGDLRKNISPVVIPSSRIVHNEKLLGAREERELYFDEGMKAGKVNHIFRLRDNLNVGVVICYEYLNSALRQRLIPACDIILVPQTNPSPGRFYDTAKGDLKNPMCAGNRAFVMANGVFTLGDDKKIRGGSTGIVSTLDKATYKEQDDKGQDEGIISPVGNVIEQFILIASINKDFNAARDTQVGQVPIKTRLIHIFEKNEILSGSEDEARKFIQLLETIESCGNRAELKEILNGEEKQATIKAFSPLMHKHIRDLNELTVEEMKKKCCSILIPDE
ncbi:TPA: tetratricopeptide repeat protein [Methanosarcinaceae archaeon]|nr:tetratricopeptide repeat protein [Methanosarcinaceae archaeon]